MGGAKGAYSGEIVKEEIFKDLIRVVSELPVDDKERDLGDFARINYGELFNVEKNV
jgi:hypothetical protein